MTPDEFYQFCLQNPDMRAELTAEGEVVSMSLSGGGTGARNAHVVKVLGQWADRDESGSVFDSSTGFILPNGAVRSPGASWVRRERLAHLSPDEVERFLPLCPDFVAEIASPSDRLPDLQAKLDEYMNNGAQLGWLIIPDTRSVYVYRPGKTTRHLNDIDKVDEEPVLPGFILDLTSVWKPLNRGR
jgi:Uma2 family endonuclease